MMHCLGSMRLPVTSIHQASYRTCDFVSRSVILLRLKTTVISSLSENHRCMDHQQADHADITLRTVQAAKDLAAALRQLQPAITPAASPW